MKKIVILLSGLLIAKASFGQGTVNFINSSGTAVTNALTMQRVVGGNTFLAALYVLPDGPMPNTAAFDLAGTQVGTNSPFAAAGIYNGGVQTAPSPPLLPGGGGSGWVQVRVWEAAFGSSYLAARDNTTMQNGRLAIVGTSNIIRVTFGNPLSVPPGAPATLINAGIQTFLVSQVPEPSTIGLGLLGVGALILLRRKNS